MHKRITSGSLFRKRSKNGGIRVTLPQINLPYITWGKAGEGVGRGDGDPGDTIEKAKGKGNKPGTEAGDGIEIEVNLDDVLKLLKDELQLPDLKPKPNQTYEEVKVVYNGLSKTGPKSLLHKKKTMAATMKRCASMGLLNNRAILPGLTQEVPIYTPINDDRRFREWNEIKIPSSNAIIFFMRDGSGSMDQYKCDIASDISYWLDLYIRAYYEKTERVFIWHDTQAREVSEKEFFSLRYGGGTLCSSAVKLMSKIIENRYDPIKWNIYGVYFGDGESSEEDNEVFVNMLKNELGKEVVNMFGQVEILHWRGYGDSLKDHIDKHRKDLPHVRNTEILKTNNDWGSDPISGEERDNEIRRVLRTLLGNERTRSEVRLEQVI